MRFDARFILSLLLTGIIFSCNQGPEPVGTIRFISSQTYGCLQEIPADMVSEEGILTWQYNQGLLDLFIHVDTHCESKLVDSLRIEENLITVVLEDTVANLTNCYCRYRQNYRFQVEVFEEAKVRCFYKAFGQAGSVLAIDRTLILTEN